MYKLFLDLTPRVHDERDKCHLWCNWNNSSSNNLWFRVVGCFDCWLVGCSCFQIESLNLVAGKKLNLKPFSDFFAMSRLCTQLLAFQNNIRTVIFAGNWTNYRKTSFLVPKCWKTLTISELCFENVYGKLEERCIFLKAYFSKNYEANFSLFFHNISYLHTWTEFILDIEWILKCFDL